MEACMERIKTDDHQTVSEWFVYDNGILKYKCHTMELPWKGNQRRVSCIPAGKYKVIKHISPKFGKSFWVLDVVNRSEILVHVGNYNHDTLGCILPGRNLIDLNDDGQLDVTSSGATMRSLWDLMPNEFELKIEWSITNPEINE
jgi:hypothetical protein